MPDAVLAITKAGLFVSLFLMKFGLGLEIAPGDLAFFRKRRRLLVRSLFVIIVLMPAAAFLIILLVQPSRPVAVALALLGASPVAPLATGKAHRSGGILPYAASLQMSVAFLSVITAPLVLLFFAWVLAFPAGFHPLHIGAQVFTSQMLPIGLGVLLGARFPRLHRFWRPLVKAASFVFVAIFLLVLLSAYRWFLKIDLLSYLAIMLTTVCALLIGHLLAPAEQGMKKTLAVETALRNPGLAMLFATLNFPQAKPLPILLPCLLVSVTVIGLYAIWQKRLKDRKE